MTRLLVSDSRYHGCEIQPLSCSILGHPALPLSRRRGELLVADEGRLVLVGKEVVVCNRTAVASVTGRRPSVKLPDVSVRNVLWTRVVGWSDHVVSLRVRLRHRPLRDRFDARILGPESRRDARRINIDPMAVAVQRARKLHKAFGPSRVVVRTGLHVDGGCCVGQLATQEMHGECACRPTRARYRCRGRVSANTARSGFKSRLPRVAQGEKSY